MPNSQLALIVDRDLDTRAMYAEFLRTEGWDVDESDDGREALAKALNRHPDVIVTETRLFGMNGFDLCQVLRHDSEIALTPIIFVTGDAFPADVRRAHAAGADDVLVKPCLPKQLSDAIQRSLELRQRAQELGGRVTTLLARTDELVDQSRAAKAFRSMLNKSHDRRYTTEPPGTPPTLLCPMCDQSLQYAKSYIGGVSAKHTEQWDYFECPTGCGTFQYRQRTRKLRRVL